MLVLKICTLRALAVLPVRSMRIVAVPGVVPSFATGSVAVKVMVGMEALEKFLPVAFGPTTTGLVKPEGVNTFG